MRKLILLLFFALPCHAADVTAFGKSGIQQSRIDYSSTNVTTGTWVTLTTSMNTDASEMEIFDSSGQTLRIGFGSPGSEVTKFYVIPGGNGRIPVRVQYGTRVAIRAISGTATGGEIDVNYYQ